MTCYWANSKGGKHEIDKVPGWEAALHHVEQFPGHGTHHIPLRDSDHHLGSVQLQHQPCHDSSLWAGLVHGLLKAEMLESGVHELEVSIGHGLILSHATEIIYVAQDFHPLPCQGSNDEACNILTARCCLT